jgi:hypothetical protein
MYDDVTLCTYYIYLQAGKLLAKDLDKALADTLAERDALASKVDEVFTCACFLFCYIFYSFFS